MLPPAPAEGSYDAHSSSECSFSLLWYTSTKLSSWTVNTENQGRFLHLVTHGCCIFWPCYTFLPHFASFPAYLTISKCRSAPAAGHHSWPSVRRQWWSWPGGDSRTLVLSSAHTVDTWLSWPALGNISQTPANFCFYQAYNVEYIILAGPAYLIVTTCILYMFVWIMDFSAMRIYILYCTLGESTPSYAGAFFFQWQSY